MARLNSLEVKLSFLGLFLGLCLLSACKDTAVPDLASTTNTGPSLDQEGACKGGGKPVGNACWYAGAAGDDCIKTCQAVTAQFNLQPTKDFAASTSANCSQVSVALGFSGTVDPIVKCVSPATEMGCHLNIFTNGKSALTFCPGNTDGVTFLKGLEYSARRFCACNF